MGAAWERHWGGMGMAWALHGKRHDMCEFAFIV
jgi:hypothetical protein